MPLPKIQHQDHSTLYQYDPTAIGYGIGTQNLAFEMPGFYYPRQSFVGRGLLYATSLSPVQPPQVYIQTAAVPIVGLGGLQAGTLYGMALQVPPDNETVYQ